MKNIHVIPTDKLSRLIIYSTLLNEFRLLDEPIDDWKHKRHIYITSTELTLAKKGDWYLGSPCYTELIRCHCDSFPNEKSKVLLNKIILTTDQDLIAHGIQAIDDEFLEWFVKNPSCDFAHVLKNPFHEPTIYRYKIIIPQEQMNPTPTENPPIKNGDVYDMGQTVNGVSRFLFFNEKWYYFEERLSRECRKDKSELTKLVNDTENDFNEVKYIGNIFSLNLSENK